MHWICVVYNHIVKGAICAQVCTSTCFVLIWNQSVQNLLISSAEGSTTSSDDNFI